MYFGRVEAPIAWKNRYILVAQNKCLKEKKKTVFRNNYWEFQKNQIRVFFRKRRGKFDPINRVRWWPQLTNFILCVYSIRIIIWYCLKGFRVCIQIFFFKKICLERVFLKIIPNTSFFYNTGWNFESIKLITWCIILDNNFNNYKSIYTMYSILIQNTIGK